MLPYRITGITGITAGEGVTEGTLRAAPLLDQHRQELLEAAKSPATPRTSTQPASTAGPLAGIRVADFTWAWAGPHGTQLLALLGAEVIKIESRTRLDHSRLRSLMMGATAGGPDASPLFNDLNLNKWSLTLNLRSPEARDVVRSLVAESDVVTQNMRPGALDRLGLGYDDLCAVKPDLVMLSASAVGATGPERLYVGYAPTFASLSGAAYMTGYPDMPPMPLSGSVDLRVGTAGAFAILAALHHRDRTGEGRHIDLSSTEVMSALVGEAFLDYSMNGRVRERLGNADLELAPHGCYPCEPEGSHGTIAHVTIAVGSDAEWAALRTAVGHPDLEQQRFSSAAGRREHEGRLDEILSSWTRSRGSREIVEELQKVGVAALPVHSGASVADDPQVQALDVMQRVEHPVVGDKQVVGAPWHLDGERVGIRSHAPLLGEANHYVLADILGLDEADIERLEQSGALE